MLLAVSRGAEAQDARPPAAVETWAGYATVGDSGNHALAGAGMRFYVSPQVSLSPRVRYERTFGDTPDDHTDFYLETALTYEYRSPANGRPRMVSPFLLVSGGVWIQRTAEETVSSGGSVYYYPGTSSSRAYWSVMVGARLFLPFARGRMYVAPEVGVGLETAAGMVAAPVALGMTLRGRTVGTLSVTGRAAPSVSSERKRTTRPARHRLPGPLLEFPVSTRVANTRVNSPTIDASPRSSRGSVLGV
jgi:hypothetical protein